jgi:hypothetical protein
VAEFDSKLTELQDVISLFLDSTITVTVENSAEVKAKTDQAKKNALVLLKSNLAVSAAEAVRSHELVLDRAVSSFNKELEGHQSRMSKRLLEVRDVLGDKLISMRMGKEAEIRDAQLLDREVAMQLNFFLCLR